MVEEEGRRREKKIYYFLCSDAFAQVQTHSFNEHSVLEKGNIEVAKMALDRRCGCHAIIRGQFNKLQGGMWLVWKLLKV